MNRRNDLVAEYPQTGGVQITEAALFNVFNSSSHQFRLFEVRRATRFETGLPPSQCPQRFSNHVVRVCVFSRGDLLTNILREHGGQRYKQCLYRLAHEFPHPLALTIATAPGIVKAD